MTTKMTKHRYSFVDYCISLEQCEKRRALETLHF